MVRFFEEEGKAPACERAIRDLAERFSIQNPKEGDKDATVLDSITLPPGTKGTFQIAVEKGYEAHIPRIRVDFFENTNYTFVVRGIEYSGDNFAEFAVPQKHNGTEHGFVVIIIENLNPTTETYALNVKAWTRSQE